MANLAYLRVSCYLNPTPLDCNKIWADGNKIWAGQPHTQQTTPSEFHFLHLPPFSARARAATWASSVAGPAPGRPPWRRQDGVLTFNEFVKYYNMYVAEKRRQFDEMYSVGPEVTCSFDVASQPSTAGIAPH